MLKMLCDYHYFRRRRKSWTKELTTLGEEKKNQSKVFSCIFFNLKLFYITTIKYQRWDLQIKYIIKYLQNGLTSISAERMRDKGLSTELEVYGNIKRLLWIESRNYSKDRILLSPARKMIWWYFLKPNGRWKSNFLGREQTSTCYYWHLIGHLFHFCLLSGTTC